MFKLKKLKILKDIKEILLECKVTKENNQLSSQQATKTLEEVYEPIPVTYYLAPMHHIEKIKKQK